MDVYSTEEQQLEAIKRWWKQYGNMISWTVLAIALTVAGVRYWQHHRQIVLENASMQYDAMMLGMKEQDKSTAIHNGEALIEQYPRTPYASLAALALAKQAIEDNELEQARSHLEWMISKSKVPEFQLVARVRLARILISLEEYKQAMSVLTVKDTDGYETLFQELKGDIYLAEGQVETAKDAFIKAWKSAPESVVKNRAILKMKLEALGQAAIIESTNNGEVS